MKKIEPLISEGLSQKEYGDLVGLHPNTIHRRVKGSGCRLSPEIEILMGALALAGEKGATRNIAELLRRSAQG